MERKQVHRKNRSHVVLTCVLSVSLGCWVLLSAPVAVLSEEPQRNEDDFGLRVNEQLGLLDSSIIMLNVDTEPGKSQDITITIDGQTYLLEIAPHSVRTSSYRVFTEPAEDTLIEHEPSPVRTVRGTVVGLPDSMVAGSILDIGLYGRIDLGQGDIYWVEPLDGHIDGALAGEHVLYHADDVIPPEGVCGNLASDVMGHVDQTQQGQGQRTAAGGEICGVTELACDADNEYYVAHGSSVDNVQNRINVVINLMNVQYENQVDITHNITVIVIHNTGNPHGNPY
ncbi:MAG: hypothetical protein IID41_09760, partial [Planctomycetes bacterium]|nr:hypothetical protein [Planctomycetota bacterium]